MIELKRTYQGLHEYQIYLDDSTELSKQFFNLLSVPNTLHAGKNIIRIGGTANLKPTTNIFVEILDVNGDPIYYETTDYQDPEDQSKVITIFIYETTPPGVATVTLLGTAMFDENGQQMPEDQQDSVNVRWQTEIPVNPIKRNNTEILFLPDNSPFVTITEKVRPYVNRTYGAGQFVTQSIGLANYKLINDKPTVYASGFEFKSIHQGNTFKSIPTGSFPSASISGSGHIYTTKIDRVLNATTALLKEPYTQRVGNTRLTHTPIEYSASVYEIHYENEPTNSLTENSRSFAFIEIDNISNISGDVDRIKTFIKSRGSVGSWEAIHDVVLDEANFREMLFDTSSFDVKTRLGKFNLTASIGKYWGAEIYNQFSGETELITASLAGHATLQYDSGSILPDSVNITVNTPLTHSYDYIKFYNSGSSGVFRKRFSQDCQYEVSFNAVGNNSVSMSAGVKPHVEVFMSGSAFDYEFGKYLDQKSFGKFVGEIDTRKRNGYRNDDVKMNFIADHTGDGLLIFKINSGDWNFSDISIKPATANGFNPCQISMLVPLPTEHVNDELDFKFEYYDYQNNQADLISYCDACDFVGGNTYIGGSYNILTGSLFVTNAGGRGVEIKSLTGGMIRSVGYSGFTEAGDGSGLPGFAMWSGSVLEESSDTYNGVGLEMHAGGNNGSFKFKTSPTPVFEVITPTFFFGTGSSAFISGSNGNIKISGSNVDISTPTFFLGTPSGPFISGSNGLLEISSSYFNVSAAGAITASAGGIGGWEIESDRLYSEGTAGADKFVGMVTASDANSIVFFAGGDVKRPDDTQTNWHVKNNGEMTGSGVYVTTTVGGVISATPMINTSNGIAEGINIGRQIYYDNTEYSITAAQINATHSVVSDIPFYLQPGETNISVTYMAEFTNGGVPSPARDIFSWIQFASASLTSGGANGEQYGAGSYDQWSNLQTYQIKRLAAGTSGTGTDERGSLNANVNPEPSYQGKHVKFNIIVYPNQAKDAHASDSLKIKNIVVTTGRSLGQNETIRENIITSGGQEA